MKKHLSLFKLTLFKSTLFVVALLLSIPITKKIFFSSQQPQNRIYANMVGDLFHPRHIEFFKKARQFGNYLIIGLHNDQDCTNYKRQSVMNVEERALAIQACKYVDEVIVNAPLTITDEFIEKHKINVVVPTNDFNKEKINHYYEAAIKRGIFQTVPHTKEISTPDLIRRVLCREKELQKLI